MTGRGRHRRTLSNNVGYIPFNSVFYNCTKLKTFVVSPDNPNYYADEQGVLYNADVTEIAYYPEGLTGDYVIPNTIKSIGGGVFIGKTNIVKITIPASVVNIGNSAFENCANLAEVLFVEGGDSLSFSIHFNLRMSTALFLIYHLSLFPATTDARIASPLFL